MEPRTMVQDVGGDGTKKKAVAAVGGSIMEIVASNGLLEKLKGSVDGSGRFTVVEKLMLDFLLEKESKGRETANAGSSLVKERHRVPDPSRRVSFNQPQRPAGRKRLTQEDRSVMRAMEELNQLSNDQLTRLMREHERDEEENCDADPGGFLAWYMTHTKFGGKASSKTPRVTETKAPLPKSTQGSPFRKASKRNEKQSSALPPIQDGRGRIVFSFMQDPSDQAPSTSRQGVLDTLLEEEDVDDGDDDSFFDLGAGPGASGYADHFDDGVKLGKSERRPARRPVQPEAENDESLGSDLDHVPEYLADMALSGKSKSQKKKRDPEMSLWDPEKPRPMPRRLRSRGAVPATVRSAGQNPGPSTAEEGEKKKK